MKTLIVTGASAGIGEAVCRLLAEKGNSVAAVARRGEKLQDLKADFPSLITPILQDIRDRSLTALSDYLKSTERVDGLINNAGLARGKESFENVADDDIEEMLETNVLGLLRVTKKVLPKMIAQGAGDIVNIGSIAGIHAYGGGAVYCATKAAVRMLTPAWRIDLLGKGIRVIDIDPGMVETEFSEVRFSGDKARAAAVYAGMRALTARDIAEAIVWSLERPPHITIQSMLIMPTDQADVGVVYRHPK